MLKCSSFAILAVAISTSLIHAQSSPSSPSSPVANILDFGTIPDNKTLNTIAIQKAIDSLAARGGGTLIIPAADGGQAEGRGAFVTGALFLKAHVNLHLDKNAILKGSTEIKDYPSTRTRIEGHFQDWLPALINAVEVDHLQIDGQGTLDGSGTPFYAAFRTAIAANRQTKNLDVPRPRLIYIQKSTDVAVSGIHLLNSGFWNLHLYNCDRVTIDGLDISAPAGSPSTDGIDIDSSRNVTVTHTTIANNDDCIALKGSKGITAMDDKDSPPVEHIRISNCTFTMGGSLITCGSEATIVRDVIVDHCTIAGPNTRGINMLRLKLRTDTPQLYEDIHFQNITLDGQGTLINIAPWSQYETIPPGIPAPKHTARNISLMDIHGTFGSFGTINPNPGDTLENISLENIDVQLAAPAPVFRNVKDLKIENVHINGHPYTPPSAALPVTTRGGS